MQKGKNKSRKRKQKGKNSISHPSHFVFLSVVFTITQTISPLLPRNMTSAENDPKGRRISTYSPPRSIRRTPVTKRSLGAVGLLLLRDISRRIRDSLSCRLVAARDRPGGGRDPQGDVKGAPKLGAKGYHKAYVRTYCFSRFGCTACGSCWDPGTRGWMPSSLGIPSPRMRRNLS